VSYANADVTKLALYAGTYAGSGTTYKYMVTPSHCGTAIPSTDTCDGTGDVAGDRMLWATAATTAATTQIIASPSAEYGGAQSATIAATAGSIAAKFCDSLKFGGYDDWYLPAMKTGTDCTDYSGEFYQVLYKNSNQYIPNNNVDCDASIVPGPLTGFSASRYLSSVEQSDDSTRAWALYFLDGSQINTGKTGNLYVRCIRRY
jgi:hypothetical protein